jgi:hypothetical protein
MFHRLLYPWNDQKKFMLPKGADAWKPDDLATGPCFIPDDVRQLVENIQFGRMFEFSGTLAEQLKMVGARVGVEGAPPAGTVFVANNRGQLSLMASAHAYVLSIAQRAAHEMAGLMLEDEKEATPEVCGLAFFAETACDEDVGARLDGTMRALGEEVAMRVADSVFLPAQLKVRFVHSVPVEACSPVGPRPDVWVSAYRISFAGCEAETVLQAIGDAMQEMPPALQDGDRSDILVLSNLWSVAKV